MTTFKLDSSDYSVASIDGKVRKIITKESWERFNTALLGVGDLTLPATSTDAIAAVFDLEGFTNFCKQIEPQLSVPLFLNEFLTWLMDQVKDTMVNNKVAKGYRLFSPLPVFGSLWGWDSFPMELIDHE